MADIKCTKCDNKLTFGGASRSLRQAMPMKTLMETMAAQIGWKRDGKGWKCRDHG